MQRSPLHADNRYTDLQRIIYRIFRAAPHNSASRFGERFFAKARFETCRNPVCISNVSNRSIGGKDPAKRVDAIARCCLSSAFFSVENGFNSGSVINHPFIWDLETGSTVAFTDIFHEVCCRKYLSVCCLPFLAPTALKSLIGTSTHQLNIVTLITKSQHDLGCPDVHASCHSCYKDIQSVSDSLVDFFSRSFVMDFSFRVRFSGR